MLENGKVRNTYEFSPYNRLTKAANAVGQVAGYEYNSLGFRVGKRITEGFNPTRNIDYVLANNYAPILLLLGTFIAMNFESCVNQRQTGLLQHF